MNRQPISVGNITPVTVKVEPRTVGSTVSSPSFLDMPFVPQVASQVVPSLQASSFPTPTPTPPELSSLPLSPLSTTVSTISNHDKSSLGFNTTST
ncbi:Mediator of RNA polymerase II transcription subunit 25 [Camellia lanceoleosa]|uniref:Mediator of RNA polymerase II transcription subunit 25 n=1 Tax=Camellia lanceoleosa TaxID=1840588 RepID=A0ACC0HTV5_9ERIC|nr:Mediator of RNA polymerase II transcription subunit 25 [Camellia lanceoleosa]